MEYGDARFVLITDSANLVKFCHDSSKIIVWSIMGAFWIRSNNMNRIKFIQMWSTWMYWQSTNQSNLILLAINIDIRTVFYNKKNENSNIYLSYLNQDTKVTTKLNKLQPVSIFHYSFQTQIIRQRSHLTKLMVQNRSNTKHTLAATSNDLR